MGKPGMHNGRRKGIDQRRRIRTEIKRLQRTLRLLDKIDRIKRQLKKLT